MLDYLLLFDEEKDVEYKEKMIKIKVPINTEIFRILAPLIDNLWIQMVGFVQHMSQSQKSRILSLLTDDPNAPD